MTKLNENGIIPFVMIFGLVGLIAIIIGGFSVDLAEADDTVTVTAVVATSVSCDADITTTAFGTITTAAIDTATDNASTTTACNFGAGCTLSVYSAGNGSNPGLATSTPSAYLIQSVTETLIAGTQEGYGLQGTTTSVGSGQTLNLHANFDKWSTSDQVGGMGTSGVPYELASSTAGISNREVLIKHLAAITASTDAADYADTITYTCAGN